MRNRSTTIAILLATFLVMMACTISYEGVSIGDDPDVSFIEDQTATAASAQLLNPAQPAGTPESEYQPASPSSGDAQALNAGTHEYSVQATDFECTCQVDGNVTVNFKFTGDQLEFTNPGGVVDVYQKIDASRYKRSFMGYYILTSGSGAQATDSIVEEERHVVIFLTDAGYVMEHYQGDAGSPCCYHTLTQQK